MGRSGARRRSSLSNLATALVGDDVHGHSRRRSSIAEGLGRSAFSIDQLVAVDDAAFRAEKLASLHPGTREWFVLEFNAWLREKKSFMHLSGFATIGRNMKVYCRTSS